LSLRIVTSPTESVTTETISVHAYARRHGDSLYQIAQRSKAEPRCASLSSICFRSASFKDSSTGAVVRAASSTAPPNSIRRGGWMANNSSRRAGALLGTDHIIAFCCIISFLSQCLAESCSARPRRDPPDCSDDGLSRPGRGADLDRPLSRADADVRVQGVNLHRRMDNGGLQFGDWCTLMLAAARILAPTTRCCAQAALAERGWFRWMSRRPYRFRCTSGQLSRESRWQCCGEVVSCRTYNYYRGSVITPFHRRPGQPQQAPSCSDGWCPAAERRRAVSRLSRWR